MIRKFFNFLGWQFYAIFPFLPYLFFMFKDFNILKAPFFFLHDIFLYIGLEAKNKTGFPLKMLELRPFLYDRFENAGFIVLHYVHQDLWAALKVFKSGVKVHYDVGSRIDGFITHCLVFCKVVLLDLRPLETAINNLEFIQTDCTNMKNIKTGSIKSISSLNAIEHFGLGRYGDSVDPLAFKKAINEIIRVLSVNGDLYFSVPIGKQRVQFNGHRIFDPETVIRLFSDLKLVEFSAIDEKNIFIENADIDNFKGVNFSCGLFHFKKRG